MRVTSHCTNHPSKEAGQRCRSCQKWLCEICFKRYRGRIYCGRKCQVTGATRDGIANVVSRLRSPVHPAWVIATVAGVSALLLTAVGIKVGQLVEVSREVDGPRAEAVGETTIQARSVVENGRLWIEAEGPPGTEVLLLRKGEPVRVLTLDAEGRSTTEGVDLDLGDGPVRLVPLARTGVDLELPQRPAPTPTRTTTPNTKAVPVPSVTTRPGHEASAAGRVLNQKTGPTPMVAPPELQLVVDAGPRIAITFDGNASTNRTTELLDLLHQHRLKVTLFVTGQFIERYPAIVRRAVLAGHEIGNHTYSHPHLTTYEQNRRQNLRPGVTREWFRQELRRTEEAFTAATGRKLQPLWRAPFGEENRVLRGWALEMGYLHVRWSSLEGASLDSRDWIADEHSSLYQNSSRIMERLLRFPELEGGIILMHMATERQEPPWQELPIFLKTLETRGLEVSTMSDLLEASPTWRPWLVRARERHNATNGD
jgi:peptidoglycan/xylan/chitin deacetylase (PgdA/CDA1 family)